MPDAGAMTSPGPLFDYLIDLEKAVAGIANTWRPETAEYRADVYRQIMMQMSYGHFAFFHADAEHLPLDTPVVTPEQRAAQLQERVRGCQRRRRW